MTRKRKGTQAQRAAQMTTMRATKQLQALADTAPKARTVADMIRHVEESVHKLSEALRKLGGLK